MNLDQSSRLRGRGGMLSRSSFKALFMSRKKSLLPSSPGTAPVHFLGSQPWWLSVLLAIATGWYLHSVAVEPLPEFAGGHSGGLAVSAMFQKMTVIGQYVLPLIFLAGAAASVLRRRKAVVLPEPEVAPEPEPVIEEVAAPEVVEVPGVEPVVVPPEPEPEVEVKAPNCPHCKKPMVLKVAGSGANAGANFWGCVDYPKCRGIRPILAPMK
jgi:hypothetical protein